jgi:alanyl-tRNA synthetase
MKSTELKDKYLEFFKKKGHKEIENSSLMPENDPTVLFTTAGMHPLVPYLIGQKHPQGKRLANNQKCIRTGDIEEVGDDVHLTFFEMLGNWSLGDYWKEEAIKWSFEFLTDKKWLGFSKEKLAITVFKGNKQVPKDTESSKIWKSLGIPEERIAYLGQEDNFWGPAGKTGPCGPDTEMFYWISKQNPPKEFDPKDPRWVEIWNDVFMQYNKDEKGEYVELKQKNVDTGFGFERVFTILEKKESVYDSSLFKPVMKKINDVTNARGAYEIVKRKIADHLRAAVFIINEGISPGNLDQGYVLRRLIRTAIRHARKLKPKEEYLKEVVKVIIEVNKKDYPELDKNKSRIIEELLKEEKKFTKGLEKGLRKFEAIAKNNKKISDKDSFLLFQSFGFPIEITDELAKERKIKVDVNGFYKELKKHQELSRTSTKGRFGSGLADHSRKTILYHTATHLLLSALREVLGNDINQRGSNITKERLRFDFNFDRKLTEEELEEVEKIVNKRIKEGIEVIREEMTYKKAKKRGIVGRFTYGENVIVYTIGKISQELCSGPHVRDTKELGHFKIIKEQSSSAGVRRIKAILE